MEEEEQCESKCPVHAMFGHPLIKDVYELCNNILAVSTENVEGATVHQMLSELSPPDRDTLTKLIVAQSSTLDACISKLESLRESMESRAIIASLVRGDM